MTFGNASRLSRTVLASLAVLALLLAGCPSEPTSRTAKFVPADAASEGADAAKQPDDKKPAARVEGDNSPPRPEGDPKASPTEDPKEPAEKPATEPPMEETDEFFPRRVSLAKALDGDLFPTDAEWLNSKPLKLKDLEGKFVILDFWTYCCINCMHILPELKKLEHQYPNELVVIGVHSAKFDGEKDTQNIADAVLRYEVEHPVLNDSEHHVWNLLGVRSWPTVVLIDPQGNLVYYKSGEFKAEEFAAIFDEAIPFYEKKGRLNRTPLKFERLADSAEKTPLRFPGKVLADEPGGRLFISDSNNNRIVIASLDGKFIDTIGSGAIGLADGSYSEAKFDHPQGCALVGDVLYVADTENHALRKIDLKAKEVKTIAGTGKQARTVWPGLERLAEEAAKAAREGGEQPAFPERWVDKPERTALNSPWAIWPHDGALYIAMAGPHQIWKMPLDESEIGPYAGNGREDIVDGPLVPGGRDALEHALGYSSFAQPSGLASDGEWLFVADSEGSSIRAVPFDASKEVRTVLGTNELPNGRLFEFGDIDGEKAIAKLQHPLDVAYNDGTIYVADTYNNKIKAIDVKTGDAKTVAGTGTAGKSDEEGTFDEPAGVAYAAGKLYVADTNNSLLRVIDLATNKVSTLTIEGLTPPAVSTKESRPDFTDAQRVKAKAQTVKATDGKVAIEVEFDLPAGWKMNPLAPAAYFVDEPGETKLVDASALGKHGLEKPAAKFTIDLPVKATGETTVTVSMNYYYCQEGEGGVCKVGSIVFEQPLTIADDAPTSSVKLSHVVPEEAP
jgi:thiol-disulfide isomerase/thioredoxin